MLSLTLGGHRSLLEWADNTPEENAAYTIISIMVVLFGGCMSGLTLGLCSMDIVELEVLKRSGTPHEQQCAKTIIPIVKNAHHLLVTLLLCNAAAMESLPILLDKMMHESVAIMISVTAVLLFGEIIPQAVCSKHGLMIGSIMAVPVRILMFITYPISWPIAKLLDRVLGGDHSTLLRRKQLKALVHLHSKEEAFGGKLTSDEIMIMTGALDLTTKTAYNAMTPIDKVFMLSTSQKIDDATVEAIMAAKPFSRLPVYRGDNKRDIVGLILVKELLEYVKKFPDCPVSSLKIRPLPRVSALTPMYDMLKLFRSGRSHMALLTQPLEEEDARSHPVSISGAADVQRINSAAPVSRRSPQRTSPRRPSTSSQDCPQLDQQQHVPIPLLQQQPSAGNVDYPHHVPLLQDCEQALQMGSKVPLPSDHHSHCVNVCCTPGADVDPLRSTRSGGTLERIKNFFSMPRTRSEGVCTSEGMPQEPTTPVAGKTRHSTRDSGCCSLDGDHGGYDETDEVVPIPRIALPGDPIGIITLEDLIEDLMQFEIVDETDKFVDNHQSVLVDSAQMDSDLPDSLRMVLELARAATLGRMSNSLTQQGSKSNRSAAPAMTATIRLHSPSTQSKLLPVSSHAAGHGGLNEAWGDGHSAGQYAKFANGVSNPVGAASGLLYRPQVNGVVGNAPGMAAPAGFLSHTGGHATSNEYEALAGGAAAAEQQAGAAGNPTDAIKGAVTGLLQRASSALSGARDKEVKGLEMAPVQKEL